MKTPTPTKAEPGGELVPLYIQLANMYVPSWGYGGPVRIMFDYARWMSGDFCVEVFTGDLHHDFTRMPVGSESIDGVLVHRHKVFFQGLVKRSFYWHSPLMCLRAAQRIRASRGPAIVHFSDFRGAVAVYAMLLKLLFSKRVKLVHSAFGSLYLKRSFRRWVYDALFMKAFLRLVDLRLVQNEHEYEAYRETCSDYGSETSSETVLLPLHLNDIPFDSTRFTGSGKNQNAVKHVRKANRIPEEALVFLFLGRLHRSKGILRTIDAFVEFSRSCSRETLLLLVGRDDGFQASIEEHISEKGLAEKVRIVNNVYENRFDYYFLADVVLGFPTIYEETMLSSVEAMACGTPLIVSREADVPYVVEEGAGLVIDFDVRKAAEAMAVVVQDLSAFQVNARSVATRHFGGAAASKKLSALFRMAMAGNHAPGSLAELEVLEQESPDQESEVERASSVASGE